MRYLRPHFIVALALACAAAACSPGTAPTSTPASTPTPTPAPPSIPLAPLPAFEPSGHTGGRVGDTAPELTGITNWINSAPLTMEELRGKVVLIDFWTYT